MAFRQLFFSPVALAFLLSACSDGRSELVLAQRGESAMTIALRTPDEPSVRYAAEELQNYVRRITGEEMIIGTCPGPAVTIELVESENPDAFELWTESGGLRISGGRRGVLYGVYEVLERFCGVQWYAPWHEVIPRRDRISIPFGWRFSGRPAFSLREEYWANATNGDFAARLRLNGGSHHLVARHGGVAHRFGAGLGNCHTFNRLLPPQKWFSAHPEYFSEINGRRCGEETQLCLTNPEVLQIVTSNVLNAVHRDPTATYFGVSQNDNQNYCTCANCRAVDEEEGAHSGSVIRFANAIAMAVAKRHPDKMIETLAYQYSRMPPKKVRLHPNVIPCLCSIECDFANPLRTGRYRENVSFREDLAGWTNQTDRLYVWDYAVNFRNYLQEFPNFSVMQDNLKFFRDHGVADVFVLGAFNGYHAAFSELKTWLLAKWMWDPNLPPGPLMERFFSGYYGKAAPFVRQYFDELCALQGKYSSSTNHPLRIFDVPSASVCDHAFLGWAADLWNRAEVSVKGEDPVYGYNVRMGALPVAFMRFRQEGRMHFVTRHPERYDDMRPLARWILDRFDEAKGQIRIAEVKNRTLQFQATLHDVLDSPGNHSAADFGEFPVMRTALAKYGKFVEGENGRKVFSLSNAESGRCTICRMDSVAYDDVEYSIRVRVRIDGKVKDAKGEAFSVGLYENGGMRDVLQKVCRLENCPGGWFWYDVGTIKLSDTQSLWVRSGWFDRGKHVANPSLGAVQIDVISLSRK